jgi:superfamily II DNA or RNA helicase
MSEPVLRKYQQKAVEDIREFFAKKGRHCIVQAPTGAGKTIIFSYICKLTANKDNKVLILTDRTELLQQAGGSVKLFNLNPFYIRAGIKYYSETFSTYIAMSQTFRRRFEQEYWIKLINKFSLIIIDEAHKQEFNYLFESGLLDNKKVIGFTATPRRTGKMRQLGVDYEKIIKTVSVKWLIKHGYLVNDDSYTISGIDLAGVEIDRMKGDYQTSALFKKFNNPKLYKGVVKNYKELTPDTKALCFCVNIEHSIRTCLQFNKKGIKAKYIVSKISKPKFPSKQTDAEMARYEEKLRVYELYRDTFKEYSGDRKEVFRGHQNGEYSVLINAGIATTGYDDKSIETIILNRATLSTTLFLQMIGRGSRIFENKTHFNILDFGQNIERLGTYAEEREWSLWHESTEGKGLPPIKDCGYDSNSMPILGDSRIKTGCNRSILASYQICPFCGFKYPKKQTGEIELKLTKNYKSVGTMNHSELYEYWKAKKHKSAWLWRQLWYKGKDQAVKEFAKKHKWSPNTLKIALKFCERI